MLKATTGFIGTNSTIKKTYLEPLAKCELSNEEILEETILSSSLPPSEVEKYEMFLKVGNAFGFKP